MANLIKELIYIDSTSILNFPDFWKNTLSKGYKDAVDPMYLTPTTMIELRTTFVLTFLFFFGLFWTVYFVLYYVV